MSKDKYAVVVEWRSGWVMGYNDRGGHNVRLEGDDRVIEFGAKSLADAITKAGKEMAQ